MSDTTVPRREARRPYEEALARPGQRTPFGTVDRDRARFRGYAPACPDGRRATVWVRRAPALFSRITFGGVGLSTGTGPEQLWLTIALAERVAGGMAGPAAGE
jgi:hypothetical protein